jgi:hypothetical protein
MRRHNVTLSEPVSEIVQTQVKLGRYKDFSAALQDAAWNFFVGTPSPFEEYGVAPQEVEHAAQRDLAEVQKAPRGQTHTLGAGAMIYTQPGFNRRYKKLSIAAPELMACLT